MKKEDLKRFERKLPSLCILAEGLDPTPANHMKKKRELAKVKRLAPKQYQSRIHGLFYRFIAFDMEITEGAIRDMQRFNASCKRPKRKRC